MPGRLEAVGRSWADRLAAVLGRMTGTRGAVLCFHGLVTEAAPSRSSMHVPLPLFEATLSLARTVGTIVPLRDLVTRHLAGRPTDGMIAVTADDAYASLLAAEPFLTRTAVPLTVFAVSGTLATGSTYWWDRIDDVCELASSERWRRFEDDCGLPEAYRRGPLVQEGPARPMRQWLLAAYGGRWPDVLEEPMARLESDVGVRTRQRSMTDAELSGFVRRTGVDVAVHTRSHAALPLLRDDDVLEEIRVGHAALRARFPGVLPYLAIPFGLFDVRTLRLAAEAGMAASLTLAGDPLRARFDADVGLTRVCVVRQQTSGAVALKLSGAGTLLNRLRGHRTTPYPPLPSPTT
jgi:peptidoglycan/xylan/chitin deacetylase (PgdA/CDA1 family)